MIIDSIVLKNFRIYEGEHRISFPLDNNKNIFIISLISRQKMKMGFA